MSPIKFTMIEVECQTVEQLQAALAHCFPGVMKPKPPPAPQPAAASPPSERPYVETVRSLNLDLRSSNGLLAGGVAYIDQLTALTHHQLLQVPNIGRKSVTEIIAALAARGLVLNGAA